MADTIIVTEEETKPAKPAEVVIVKPQASKTEKVVTEKTTVTETRLD